MFMDNFSTRNMLFIRFFVSKFIFQYWIWIMDLVTDLIQSVIQHFHKLAKRGHKRIIPAGIMWYTHGTC